MQHLDDYLSVPSPREWGRPRPFLADFGSLSLASFLLVALGISVLVGIHFFIAYDSYLPLRYTLAERACRMVRGMFFAPALVVWFVVVAAAFSHWADSRFRLRRGFLAVDLMLAPRALVNKTDATIASLCDSASNVVDDLLRAMFPSVDCDPSDAFRYSLVALLRLGVYFAGEVSPYRARLFARRTIKTMPGAMWHVYDLLVSEHPRYTNNAAWFAHAWYNDDVDAFMLDRTSRWLAAALAGDDPPDGLAAFLAVRLRKIVALPGQ